MSGWSSLSPTAAYWAGFMMADGYFYRRRAGSTKASCVVLQLSKKDEDHVHRFVDFLGSSKAPYALTSGGFPQVRVDVYRDAERIITELEAGLPISVTPRKAWDFQSIPEALKFPFLIGFIDGDGSVIWSKDRPKAVQLFGEDEEFVLQVKAYLNCRYPPLRPALVKTSVTPLKNGFIFRLQGPRAARMVQEVKHLELPTLDRKWTGKDPEQQRKAA